MLNEIFFLQIFTFIVLFFFINSINISLLWYLAGFYLIILGFFLFLNEADIFVGFLWVIDLGVGLIFFIFILHFTTFLHQKSNLEISSRNLFLILFFLFFLFFFYFFSALPSKYSSFSQLKTNWFFFISWYNYYLFFNTYTITDLNLLRELYFYNNSFEFFLINFVLFYGVFAAISFCFLIKRIFLILNFGQLMNINIISSINSIFFIRNQNFLSQQNTSTGTRAWRKKKIHKTIN